MPNRAACGLVLTLPIADRLVCGVIEVMDRNIHGNNGSGRHG